MCGNRDVMLEAARREFLRNDQELLIRKYGLKSDEKYLYINVLNQLYQVERREGRINGNNNDLMPDHDIMMAIFRLRLLAFGRTCRS